MHGGATRYRTATGAGVLAALLLIAIFGSPLYGDWVRANADPDTAGGWFLHLLAWPSWQIDADASLRDNLAGIVRAILLLVFSAVFLALLPGTQLARVRGTVSQLLAGWGAYIFAGAAAGLLAAVIRSDPSLLDAFGAAAAGAGYGLFVGWVVGLAAMGGARYREMSPGLSQDRHARTIAIRKVATDDFDASP